MYQLHIIQCGTIIIIISGFGIYGAAVVPDSGVGKTWRVKQVAQNYYAAASLTAVKPATSGLQLLCPTAGSPTALYILSWTSLMPSCSKCGQDQEQCLIQVSKSNFSVTWPWPLTWWPQKSTVSFPCPVDHQSTAKSAHLFWKHCVHKTGKGWTNKSTDGRTERSITSCLYTGAGIKKDQLKNLLIT